MVIPNTLQKQAKKLFPEDSELERAFVSAIMERRGRRQALLWCGERSRSLPFEVEELPPLVREVATRGGVALDLPAEGAQAGKSSLHQEGAFYCMDLSSVVLGSVSIALKDHSALQEVVDLCSAPGGKAILAWRLLGEPIIANEVIGKRHGMLVSNLSRCAVPSVVTRMDVSRYGEQFPARVHYAIVDAPCSGQSLPGKKDGWQGAFHPSTINMNMNRQRRILANAAKLIAPGGFLSYLTCTFAREENEKVLSWFLKKNPDFFAVELPHLIELQSPYTELPCYRVFPWHNLGGGGFAVLLRREGELKELAPIADEVNAVWRSSPVE